MHGDSALDAKHRLQIFPNAKMREDANLLIFPTLDAANIAFNLLKNAAGEGMTIGPILLGASKPGAHPHALGDRAPHHQHDRLTAGRGGQHD